MTNISHQFLKIQYWNYFECSFYQIPPVGSCNDINSMTNVQWYGTQSAVSFSIQNESLDPLGCTFSEQDINELHTEGTLLSHSFSSQQCVCVCVCVCVILLFSHTQTLFLFLVSLCVRPQTVRIIALAVWKITLQSNFNLHEWGIYFTVSHNYIRNHSCF